MNIKKLAWVLVLTVCTALAASAAARLAQTPPALFVPSREVDAKEYLIAEAEHLTGPLTRLLTATAMVRERYHELQAERTRLLGMNRTDPAYAPAAKANNDQWAAYRIYTQKNLFDARNELRKARNDGLRIRGPGAEVAWLQRWGDLPEWRRLMKTWAAVKQADDDATIVLALGIPTPLEITPSQPPQPPQPPVPATLEGTWVAGSSWTFHLDGGGGLRTSGFYWPQDGPGTWSRSGNQVTLQWRTRSVAAPSLWEENTFTGELQGERIPGTLVSIPHGGAGRTQTAKITLMRPKLRVTP